MQLSIQKLERLIEKAKAQIELDSSLSDVLEFDVCGEADTHLGDDHVAVWIKSGYAECNGKQIYNHWEPVRAEI
jgi:hypothetical protein